MTYYPPNFDQSGLTQTRRKKLAQKAAEDAPWFIENGVAGGSGVFRFGDTPTQSLAASQLTPPSMRVSIAEGGAIVNGVLAPIKEAKTVDIPSIGSQVRWDILVIDINGVLRVVRGETGVASDPTVGSNAESLWRIVHRVGEVSVKESDDSVNGYLEDLRSWVN